MKTRKLFALALISLFVFSPFLNFESWGALQSRLPIKLPAPTPRMEPVYVWCVDICESNNGIECCYETCTDDDGASWYINDTKCDFIDDKRYPF